MLKQRRAADFDTRHAAALAGLAGKVAGDNRQDIDGAIELEADLAALPPGDDPDQRLAGLQLELQPLALLDRHVGVKHRAAGAELADLADLTDAAEHQRAGLEISPGVVRRRHHRHLAGQRINRVQHFPALAMRLCAHFRGAKVYEW